MLAQKVKNKITTEGEKVYWAYLALDLADNAKEGNFLTTQLKDLPTSVQIYGKEVKVTLKPVKDGYEVVFPPHKVPLPTLKPIEGDQCYTDDEKRQIVTSQTFFIRSKKQSENDSEEKAEKASYVLGATINNEQKETYEVGGPDKINLFRVHIDNLRLMLNSLNSPDDSRHAMLVALTTGSGKSFTQAIWMMVLYMAKVQGIFTTPSHLVNQLHDQVKDLIPENIFNKILVVPQHGPASLEEKEEKSSAISADNIKSAALTIAATDTILENHWTLFNRDAKEKALDHEACFFSSDEPHLTTSERQKLRLKDICENYSSLLSTATPSDLIYQLAGKVPPLLSMSRKQRERYAVMPEFIYSSVKPYKEHFAPQESSWIRKKLVDLLSYAASGLISLFPDAPSPVEEALSTVRYQFKSKEIVKSKNAIEQHESLRNQLRWNIAVPAADKMLIISRDHDTLVTLDQTLENSLYDVYSNGNTIDVNLAGLSSPDKNILYRDFKEKLFDACHLSPGYRFSDMPENSQYKKNILYVKIENDTLHYAVIDPTGTLKKGTITKTQLTPYNDSSVDALFNPDDQIQSIAEQLNSVLFISLKHDILKITTQRQHTNEEIHYGNDHLIEKVANQSGKRMKKHAEMNLFCGVVNTTLKLITGKTFIELDQNRLNNLDSLCNQVIQKAVEFEDWDVEKLEHYFHAQEGLSQKMAADLAQNTKQIISFLLHQQITPESKKSLIDNWFYDANNNKNELFENKEPFNFTSSSLRKDDFKKTPFAWTSGYKRYLCENITNNESKIPDKKIFTGFTKSTMNRNIAGFIPNPKTKKWRQPSLLEMTPISTEDSFTPNNTVIVDDTTHQVNETIEQADNAFRLGLIPWYIGNVRATGFNDKNLKVVLTLVSDELDLTNSPENDTQQSGRLRGESPDQQYFYVKVNNVGAKNLLDLSLMNNDTYIDDFLKATKAGRPVELKRFGLQMAEEFRRRVYTHLTPEGKIDDEDALKHDLFEVIRETAEKINEENVGKKNNQLITNEELTKVLNLIDYNLTQDINKKRNLGTLPFLVRLFIAIATVIIKWYYSSYTNAAQSELSKKIKELELEAKKPVSAAKPTEEKAAAEMKVPEKSDAKQEPTLTASDKLQRAKLYKKIVSMDFATLRKDMTVTGGGLLTALLEPSTRFLLDLLTESEKFIDAEKLKTWFQETIAIVEKNDIVKLPPAAKKAINDANWQKISDDIRHGVTFLKNAYLPKEILNALTTQNTDELIKLTSDHFLQPGQPEDKLQSLSEEKMHEEKKEDTNALFKDPLKLYKDLIGSDKISKDSIKVITNLFVSITANIVSQIGDNMFANVTNTLRGWFGMPAQPKPKQEDNESAINKTFADLANKMKKTWTLFPLPPLDLNKSPHFQKIMKLMLEPQGFVKLAEHLNHFTQDELAILLGKTTGNPADYDERAKKIFEFFDLIVKKPDEFNKKYSNIGQYNASFFLDIFHIFKNQIFDSHLYFHGVDAMGTVTSKGTPPALIKGCGLNDIQVDHANDKYSYELFDPDKTLEKNVIYFDQIKQQESKDSDHESKKSNKSHEDTILQYTVIDLSGKIVKGEITQAEFPGMYQYVRKNAALADIDRENAALEEKAPTQNNVALLGRMKYEERYESDQFIKLLSNRRHIRINGFIDRMLSDIAPPLLFTGRPIVDSLPAVSKLINKGNEEKANATEKAAKDYLKPMVSGLGFFPNKQQIAADVYRKKLGAQKPITLSEAEIYPGTYSTLKNG